MNDMRARFILGIVGAAPAALTLAASAGAGPVQTRMPFTEPFDNPCTGEALVATGTLVVTSDITLGTDGKTHIHSNVRFDGTSATAPVSHHKYVVQEQTLDGENADGDAAPSTTHFKVKIHWVRTGEEAALIDGDDFYDWFHIHMTVNANGVPTSVNMDTEDDVCR